MFYQFREYFACPIARARLAPFSNLRSTGDAPGRLHPPEFESPGAGSLQKGSNGLIRTAIGSQVTPWYVRLGFLRFDGHPPSGAQPRKGCPKWRPSNGRSPVSYTHLTLPTIYSV